MNRRSALLAILLVVLIASVACDDGGDESPAAMHTATPTATMTFSPSGALAVSPPFTGTPEPTATPLGEAYRPRTTGWVVFLRDRDLHIARLDGSDDRALTSRGTGGGYAGVATHADGTQWVYYTDMREAPGDQAMFDVLRQPLEGGMSDELFVFAGGNKQIEFFRHNAHVSPDGRFVAYSHPDGMRRRDLVSGTDILFAADGDPDCVVTVTSCRGHFFPIWSPGGRELAIRRIFFEGGEISVVDPGNPEAGEWTYRGGTIAFSPAGDAACILDDYYADAQTLVVVGAGDHAVFGEYRIAPPTAAQYIRGCAWLASDRVATAYDRLLGDCIDNCRQQGIAFLEMRGAVVKEVALPSTRVYEVVGSLKLDEAVIVFAGRAPLQNSVNLVVTLDGSIAPFAIPEGRVLAVVDE